MLEVAAEAEACTGTATNMMHAQSEDEGNSSVCKDVLRRIVMCVAVCMAHQQKSGRIRGAVAVKHLFCGAAHKCFLQNASQAHKHTQRCVLWLCAAMDVPCWSSSSELTTF